jgi:hypothetical protein
LAPGPTGISHPGLGASFLSDRVDGKGRNHSAGLPLNAFFSRGKKNPVRALGPWFGWDALFSDTGDTGRLPDAPSRPARPFAHHAVLFSSAGQGLSFRPGEGTQRHESVWRRRPASTGDRY